MTDSNGSLGGSTGALPPLVGAAVVGVKMEESVTIKDGLCSPVINRGLPVHYYGVFDGHGGPHFAIMCREEMHEILKEELMNPSLEKRIGDESVLQEMWRNVISRVFRRTEYVAHRTCVCGSVGFRCGCGRGGALTSGTTAVVVVLTEKHFVVGNCGHSRAVLYRGGRIVPLSFDHMPYRGDEKARIKRSGGHIICIDVPRVQGILPMSRAIGDMHLKPLVISEPEVTFTRRDEEDEFVIVASNGMWDAIPTDLACRIVHVCLKKSEVSRDNISLIDLNVAQPEINDDGDDDGDDDDDDGVDDESRFSLNSARSESAAKLLSSIALARGSSTGSSSDTDTTMSVVVIDLKRDVSSQF